MSTTQTQQPDALRLADVLEKMTGYDWNKTYCEAAFQLRHIQRQNECLTAENEALKEKVAGCDIMGLAEEQRQLRGPFHGIGTPNRAMFD